MTSTDQADTTLDDPEPQRRPVVLVVAVALLALLAVGLAGPALYESPAEKIGKWRADGGTQALNDISSRGRDLMAAGASNDAAQVSGACSNLRSAAARGSGYRPIPDAEAQREWSEFLAGVDRSTSACVQAMATNSPALLETMRAEMDAAEVHITRAGDRMHWIEENCTQFGTEGC